MRGNINKLAVLHLIIGSLGFIAFVVTGRFMRIDFPDKDLITPELRILMRSRHIYILFSALIHLMLGVYVRPRAEVMFRAFQYVGSVVLVSSTVILVWAFATESYGLQHFSDISRCGIYMSLAGVIIHIIGGIGQNRLRERADRT